MSETSKTLAGPGNSKLPVAEAERQLARLCRSAASGRSEITRLVQLMAAAVMTSAGAGLRLFTHPGAAKLAAAVCALLVAARIVLPVAAARAGRKAGEPPGWVAAAAVHRGSLPGRVPPATLTAVDRYLPALRGGCRSAHLYVGPCAGVGKHTPVCSSAATWAPEPGGRHRLLIVGEHVAAEPALAAACLAHEAGHVRGWTYRVLTQLHHLRQAGWGWAVAGLIGASWGWPGVLAASAAFQAISLMLVWAVEVMCDRAAVRAVGRAGYRQALSRLAEMSREHRRQRHGRLRVTSLFVCCLAGPPHPPLALRRALIRGPHPARQNSQPAVWQDK